MALAVEMVGSFSNTIPVRISGYFLAKEIQ